MHCGYRVSLLLLGTQIDVVTKRLLKHLFENEYRIVWDNLLFGAESVKRLRSYTASEKCLRASGS